MKYKYEDDSQLPLYDAYIELEGNTGIKLISIVENPAIEMKGMCFSSEKNFQFKSNQDKQIIVGPALIPNKKIPRDDEDGIYLVRFKEDAIRMMVEKFNATGDNRRINVEHTSEMVEGFIIESWIVEDEYYDKSRFYGFNVPKGTWMVAIKIEDEKFWNEEVKGNGKFGFSIEGLLGTKAAMLKKSNVTLKLSDIIDELTTKEIIKLAKEFDFDLLPVHPNCKCKIVKGIWILGESESGNCNQCIMLRDEYNSGR